jgi:hypothetical protein
VLVQSALVSWPCETMALWPGRILVLDTQDRIVIWIGREVAAALDGPAEQPGEDSVLYGIPEISRSSSLFLATHQSLRR